MRQFNSVGRQIAASFASAFAKVEKLADIPDRIVDFMTQLGVEPSPVVAAILDAIQGRPVTTIDDAKCEIVFGCKLDALPKVARRILVVRAGGRGGKTSRILAPLAIFYSLKTQIPTLRQGEHAVALIVAPELALAIQALSFVRGYFEDSPLLRGMLVQPRGAKGQIGTATGITIRRPDGKLVDIRVGTSTGRGKHARGRTLVFAAFDEAAFFASDEEKVSNDQELYRAAIQRVVPGGLLALVSTPWISGVGVFEELFLDWGMHDEALCAQGGTRDLNPTWDPTGEIETHLRRTDPDNASREIDAIPLDPGNKLFFTPAMIASCTRESTEPLPPLGSLPHYGGADLGFRRNSSALALSRWENGKVRVAYVEEVKPPKGATLKPTEVARGFCTKSLEYMTTFVLGDMHGIDSAQEEFAKHTHPTTGHAVSYMGWASQPDENLQKFVEFRRLIAEGLLEVPDLPAITGAMRRVTVKPTPGGGMKIELPRMGSAHGDVLQAVVLSATGVPLPQRMAAASVSSRPKREQNLRGGGF